MNKTMLAAGSAAAAAIRSQHRLLLVVVFFIIVSSSNGFSTSSSSSSTNIKNKNNNNDNDAYADARHVAVRALTITTTTSNNQFPLRKLESDKYYNKLELRDKRFAKNLVSTTTRRQGQIDKILNLFLDIPLEKQSVRRRQDAIVQATLRVGAAQLLFLKTPEYAAIKETVQVLRKNHRIKIPESKIKFVNAVLRRISRELETRSNLLELETSPSDNIVPWLLEEWEQCWGKEKCNAIAEAAMKESPIYLSANHHRQSQQQDKMDKLQSIQDAFQQEYQNNHQSHNKESGTTPPPPPPPTEILSHGSIYIDKASFPGAISKWPLYNEGEWWVQDASATLPAIALYNSLLGGDDNNSSLSSSDEEGRQLSIVDVCAAPGGKTAQLLSLGFSFVTAIEFSPKRAKQLVSNLQRLRLQDRCNVVVKDACNWYPPSPNKEDEGGGGGGGDGGRLEESISGILLDVPCSSTGTASRRPDVLRRDENSLDELLETQYNLATHCIDNLLEPGGILVYATCSLLKRESEDQIQKLLNRNENDDDDGAKKVQILPFSKGEIPGFDEAIDELGCLRVIPGCLPGKLSSCDGFFVARLQKQQ